MTGKFIRFLLNSMAATTMVTRQSLIDKLFKELDSSGINTSKIVTTREDELLHDGNTVDTVLIRCDPIDVDRVKSLISANKDYFLGVISCSQVSVVDCSNYTEVAFSIMLSSST